MFAAAAARINAEDPLSGLEVGERPESRAPEGWTTVRVRAASLNHHDLWSLRGVGLDDDRLPMILGCDAAGVDAEGNEVVVHGVISSPDWRDDETLDPALAALRASPGHLRRACRGPAAQPGAQAARLSFEQAACLPTAWFTAYRCCSPEGGSFPARRCSCRARAAAWPPP